MHQYKLSSCKFGQQPLVCNGLLFKRPRRNILYRFLGAGCGQSTSGNRTGIFRYYQTRKRKDFYVIRYSEFVVPLVKAVQEQQSIILDQQIQIDELKELVKELMKK